MEPTPEVLLFTEPQETLFLYNYIIFTFLNLPCVSEIYIYIYIYVCKTSWNQKSQTNFHGIKYINQIYIYIFIIIIWQLYLIYWALSKLYHTWFATNPQSKLVTTDTVTIYIYIYIYIYVSCRTFSTDFPNSLLPFVLIIHRFWHVLKTIS